MYFKNFQKILNNKSSSSDTTTGITLCTTRPHDELWLVNEL